MTKHLLILATLVFFTAGLDACKKKEDDTDEDEAAAGTTKTSSSGGGGGESEDGAPELGDAITISDVTQTSFEVSWGEATDPGGDTFTYKVVYASSSDDIDTIDEADAITGDAVTDDLDSTVTSTTITGLTIATDYAVTVVVTNSAGKRSIYEPVEQTTLPMRIFVTATRMAASFANAAAVDAYCDSDANNPDDGSTFKAMIAGAAWRKACTSPRCASTGTTGQVDWVFEANTPYGRLDGTMIGTTNAYGILPDPILAALDPDNNYSAWGGFDSTWQSSGNNCTAWSASGSTADGIDASPYYLDAAHWLDGASPGCSGTASLVCVEQ